MSITLQLGMIQNVQIGSNSTNEFPDYDINDPWPSNNRGYYFYNTAYMSTSLLISPVFSYSMWLFIQEPGYIINKSGIFSIYALSSVEYLISIIVMNGQNLTSSVIITNNTWNYISFSIQISNYNSDLRSYLNNALKNTVTIQEFIEDNSASILYIGSISGGFQGFIASINFYSTNTHISDTYSLACTDCTKCSYCLSTCSILEDSSSSCKACPNDYNYGCLNGISNICQEGLCEKCNTRGTSICLNCTAHASGAPCSCAQGYYDAAPFCLLCFPRCETCSIAGFYCSSCVTGYLLQENICVKNCATGYTKDSSSKTCSFVNKTIVDLYLNDAIILSNLSNINIGLLSNNSYPVYDSHDPWPARNRGYYFWPGSYMTGNFTFSSSVYISIWLKIYSNGFILSKNSSEGFFSLASYQNTISANFSLASSDILSSNATFNESNWLCYTLLLSTNSTTTTLSVYINSTALTPITFLSFYSDNLSIFNISSVGMNFTGFIWRLLIENSSPANLLSILTNPPLSNCSNSTYPPNCLPCPSTCIHNCDEGSCNMCPDKLCKICDSFTRACLNCSNNSSLINGSCICNIGYYNNSGSCAKCSSLCLACNGSDINHCTQCKNGTHLFSQQICSICAIGYGINNNNACILMRNTLFDLELNNTLEGVLIDSASSIEVITGENGQFYPDYDSSDPFTAFLRGYYFNGTSSYLKINDTSVLFPFTFTIETWINPMSSNGVILQRKNFNLTIEDFYPTYYLNLTNSTLSNACGLLANNSWNHLIISFEFNVNMTTATCSSSYSSHGYLLDINTTTYFGTNFTSFFQGFLYSFKIYASILSRRLTVCLDYCDQCLDSGYCIPNCDITKYWVGPHYNNCTNCLQGCNQGCRNNQSCSLCSSELCIKCTSFDQFSCLDCVPSAVINENCACINGYSWNPFNNTCFVCNASQFISNYSCLDCPEFCSTCVSAALCLTCIENSIIVNSVCQCSLGYYGINYCARNILDITITVDSNNQILIFFSEPLQYEINNNDVIININIPATWNLQMWQPNEYKLSVNFTGTVENTTAIIIDFSSKEKIVSTTNGTPLLYLYTANFHEIVSPNSAIIAAAESLGKTTSTAATAAVVGVSMMNPNPSCLWSFINTVQMLVFVVLANVTVTPKSRGFLIGLRNYNFFPNTFEYFVSPGKSINFPSATDLGYASDSVILNIGKPVTAFVFFMIFWGILYLLMIMIKKNYCTKKWYVDLVKEFFYDYKYGFFIRFGIANYIEFEIAALIGLINYKDGGAYSIINTILSSVILLLNLLAPILCLVMVIKRRNTTPEEKIEYESMYGTLFYEFNDDKGLMASNFYVYFFIKRGFYGVILMLLGNYGLLQMSLIVTICLAYFFYLLMFRPFSDSILNYSNLFCELSTLIIFGLIAWLQFEVSSNTQDNIDSAIYYLINVIMGAQMAASLGLLIKSLIEKLQASRLKKKSQITPVFSFEAEEKHLKDNTQDLSKADFDIIKRYNTRSQDSSKLGKLFYE